MKLRLKIGTHSAGYYDVRGDLYAGAGEPPELSEPPELGTRISWQEMLNGEWQSGLVDTILDVDGKPLYFVERM